MLNYDSNNAYSIINARHEDIRNAEEARRFAKAEQGESTSSIMNMVKGIARFAQNLSLGKAGQNTTQTSVRLSRKRHA